MTEVYEPSWCRASTGGFRLPFNRTRNCAPVPATAPRNVLLSKPRSSNTIIRVCRLRSSRPAWVVSPSVRGPNTASPTRTRACHNSTPATITRWLYEVEVPGRTRSTTVTAGGANSCSTRWK
ncbi:hypothetical protein B0E53_00703 [Micromonospora sp. MH33]|nr:hypothetical protein B0E53_00703 [Micromonospora sp. MH33]